MFLCGNFALKLLQTGKIMSNNKITQFFLLLLEHKWEKSRQENNLLSRWNLPWLRYCVMLLKNASWDTIWSSSELHPCLFSCFVCYIWVCKNLSELCCKIFCCSDIFLLPVEQPTNTYNTICKINRCWQGKFLNPRAIRKTLLHFVCQPRLDLETILALLWNIPHPWLDFCHQRLPLW